MEEIENIFPFAIFIYVALLLHGVIDAPNDKARIKINEWKNSILPFVIVWLGILLFVFLIFVKHLVLME